jgi:ketosteroid isomerase-like protein
MAVSTSQIAEQFTALCKQGKLDEAGERYWADNVVSLEPIDGEMARVKGRDAVRAKSEQWFQAHDLHQVKVDGPQVNGEQFIVHYSIDATDKKSGQRQHMEEEALYTVANGKIVEERFFARVSAREVATDYPSTAKVSPACACNRATSFSPSAAPGVVTPPGPSFSVNAIAVSAIILDVEP